MKKRILWRLTNQQLYTLLSKEKDVFEFCTENRICYEKVKEMSRGKKYNTGRFVIINHLAGKRYESDVNALVHNNINELVMKLNLYCVMNKLKHIVFIDGDNSREIFNTLLERKCNKDYFIVTYFRKGVCKNQRCLKKRDNISVKFSNSLCEDAADVNMTFEVSLLHRMLDRSVEFVLLSKDKFIIELHEILLKDGRNSLIADDNYVMDQLIDW